MTRSQEAYRLELRRAARRLGLRDGANLERRIISYFENQVSLWIQRHGLPANLTNLADFLASCLHVEFVEVSDDDDTAKLLKRISPEDEPRIIEALSQLDDGTDAITFRREKPDPWDMPFLALINCRGRHYHRRFFSKWHELAHRLLEGDQLAFVFRKTEVLQVRDSPEETLVDAIAGAIAFHPDLFAEPFAHELSRAGRLTFDVVDRMIWEVAPDASWQATLKACVRAAPTPVCLVRAGLGFKKYEEAELARPGTHMPVAKLRVQTADYSQAAKRAGIRFHRNMLVPESSIVLQAFNGIVGRSRTGPEQLEAWTTSSSGPIGSGPVHAEALRRGDEVWALMHFE